MSSTNTFSGVLPSRKDWRRRQEWVMLRFQPMYPQKGQMNLGHRHFSNIFQTCLPNRRWNDADFFLLLLSIIPTPSYISNKVIYWLLCTGCKISNICCMQTFVCVYPPTIQAQHILGFPAACSRIYIHLLSPLNMHEHPLLFNEPLRLICLK